MALPPVVAQGQFIVTLRKKGVEDREDREGGKYRLSKNIGL